MPGILASRARTLPAAVEVLGGVPTGAVRR
jgi:hypothetical protein